MKKIILILCCCISLSFISCSDWLEVDPKAEIKLDVMFESEQGVKDALIGSYLLMSSESLYGSALTCTFLDVLGQQYTLLGSTASRYYNASFYIYTGDVNENIIDGIWSGLYNVIANINALIEGLEKSKDILHPTIYAMSKAEAYSLRAFIYLDLVRLFSYGNLAQRPEKLKELAIPYVKRFDKEIVPRETLENVLKFIHEDLDVAMPLFEAYDPASRTGNRPDDYTVPNEDHFYDWNVRKYRMNLKSTLATQMRLNLWEGNYAEAKKDALYLLNLGHSFVTRMEGEDKDRDLTFSTEMLFGVETFERFDKVIVPYFTLTEKNNATMNYQALYLPESRVNELYEISANIGISDWRYLRWWDRSDKNHTFLKFWEYENMVYKNNMPLIKLPEVYYTACECLLREGGEKNKNQAITYLNTIRNHRNIPIDLNLSYTLTEDEVWNELVKEMKKEYIGEGQMFYYYKRIGAISIPYGPAVAYDDNVYVLPLPQKELDFGN